MKILVLGSGLMGPAAAFNAMCDPDVTAVTLADRDAAQLELRARLAGKPGMDKLTTTQLDLADFGAATALMAQHDVIVAALPNVAIPAGYAPPRPPACPGST
ncbi:MAG: saccharopine dehydrogenase NADP-binding domain-containing protein [Caldilineaceae bacterium]